MASIEDCGHPLVFRANGESLPPASTLQTEGATQMWLALHSLAGMQKEALVSVTGGATWRMASDEGHYLNGTDLAPFPLAFFTAGQQFSLMSDLVRAARARQLPLAALQIHQDNYYTMNGSFLRGDAVGGAMPADVMVCVDSDAPLESIIELIRVVGARSTAHALAREVISNRFSLSVQGRKLPLAELPTCLGDAVNPAGLFSSVLQLPDPAVPPNIIEKTEAAERVEGVEGGAGSSLRSEQKRTLHVHGEAQLLDGLRMETQIELIKPIGSSFRFLCDEAREFGGLDSAPPPLAYLSAAIGFCFLTQLGRFAHISKQDLRSYSIVQDNHYPTDSADADTGAATLVSPIETHVFIDADISDADAQRLVTVAEQTCFLHATMRDNYPSNIKLKLNGQEIDL